MVNKEPVPQEIELGLRNDTQSQVLAGLNAGDEIALVSQTGVEQLRSLFSGGGN